MHFAIKEINGKKYHYASDYIYIAKGKTKLKNKIFRRTRYPFGGSSK